MDQSTYQNNRQDPQSAPGAESLSAVHSGPPQETPQAPQPAAQEISQPQITQPSASGYPQPGLRPEPRQAKPPKKTIDFSVAEKLFAWLCLVLGYFFWRAFPMSKTHIGSAVFIAAMYAISFLLPLRGKAHFSVSGVAVLGAAAVALVSGALWADRGSAFLCFLYALLAYAYLVYAATGNSIERSVGELVGSDLLRALIVYPFSAFSKLFPALFSTKVKGASFRGVLKVLLGLAIAVIPTAMVIALLAYDDAFNALFEKIFSFPETDVTDDVLRFVLGIPVAMYFFGLIFSSVREKPVCADADTLRERAESARILGAVTALSAVIPLLCVYVIFFISQWGYYTSAFTGVLPAGLSYADYARDGFFQLCTVAAINLAVVFCVNLFIKREHNLASRMISAVYTLVTIVLIATAISKLFLYINRWGLTHDRLYAAWFMLLMTALFAVILTKQFCPRFKALPTALALTVIMYLCLSVCGSSRLIAKYNVDKYISGELAEVDIDTLYLLGDDAIPQMLRLERHMAETSSLSRDRAKNLFIGEHPNYYSHTSAGKTENEYGKLVYLLDCRAGEHLKPLEHSISSMRAEKLLAEAGFTGEPTD